MTFSASFEVFGSTEVVELLAGGDDMEVDDDNKMEYVELMKSWLSRKRCRTHQLNDFLA